MPPLRGAIPARTAGSGPPLWTHPPHRLREASPTLWELLPLRRRCVPSLGKSGPAGKAGPTQDAASCYLGLATDYLASFKVAQLGRLDTLDRATRVMDDCEGDCKDDLTIDNKMKKVVIEKLIKRKYNKVGDDLKVKVVQAAAAKVKKAARKVEGVKPKGDEDKDDYDAMAEDKQCVQQRINSGDKTKQTKLNFKLVTKKEANLLSDEDAGNFSVQ